MKKFRKSRHARLAATCVAVVVFASLAGVGYAGGLVPFVHSSPTAKQYPPSKVTICHHTHSKTNPFVTITVSERALPAHLRHGDTPGPCPPKGTTGAHGAITPKVKQTGPRGKGLGKGHLKGSGNTAHAPVQNHGKGKGHAPAAPSDLRGSGHGHANGHSSTHGQGHGQANGHGQGHGHDQVHGQGHGQAHGHGPSDTHGNSGGKGKDHKP